MGFAIYALEHGYFKIEQDGDEIVYVKRVSEKPADMGKPTAATDRVAKQLTEFFEGKRQSFDFPYRLVGTEFQKKVWTALCDIPYGETRTYKEIATAIGNPKASRAVGMANNRNPITIAVPCHRVIGASGKLVGYAGGMAMKEALLRMEQHHVVGS